MPPRPTLAPLPPSHWPALRRHIKYFCLVFTSTFPFKELLRLEPIRNFLSKTEIIFLEAKLTLARINKCIVYFLESVILESHYHNCSYSIQEYLKKEQQSNKITLACSLYILHLNQMSNYLRGNEKWKISFNYDIKQGLYYS